MGEGRRLKKEYENERVYCNKKNIEGRKGKRERKLK